MLCKSETGGSAPRAQAEWGRRGFEVTGDSPKKPIAVACCYGDSCLQGDEAASWEELRGGGNVCPFLVVWTFGQLLCRGLR